MVLFIFLKVGCGLVIVDYFVCGGVLFWVVFNVVEMCMILLMVEVGMGVLIVLCIMFMYMLFGGCVLVLLLWLYCFV